MIQKSTTEYNVNKRNFWPALFNQARADHCVLDEIPFQSPSPKDPPNIKRREETDERKAYRLEYVLKLVLASHNKGTSKLNSLVLHMVREALRP
jgi:hypothetical protein